MRSQAQLFFSFPVCRLISPAAAAAFVPGDSPSPPPRSIQIHPATIDTAAAYCSVPHSPISISVCISIFFSVVGTPFHLYSPVAVRPATSCAALLLSLLGVHAAFCRHPVTRRRQPPLCPNVQSPPANSVADSFSLSSRLLLSPARRRQPCYPAPTARDFFPIDTTSPPLLSVSNHCLRCYRDSSPPACHSSAALSSKSPTTAAAEPWSPFIGQHRQASPPSRRPTTTALFVFAGHLSDSPVSF